jgi:membrane protein
MTRRAAGWSSLFDVKPTKLSVALAREAYEVRRQEAHGWLRGTTAGRTVARTVRGIADIELADRAMTLAAQEFTSVLPLIVAVGTIGNLDAVSETFADQVGIDPGSLTSVTRTTADVLESSPPTFAAFGVIGLLMVLVSGTSFARALGRVYGKVWEVPVLSLRGWWRWVAVLLAVATALALLGRVRLVTSVDWIGPPLAIVGEALVWFGLWMAVPYLLTEGRLAGRVLWATAALTSAGLTVVGMVGTVYLPRAIASAQGKFGELGVVFTGITWMFVQSAVVVAATVVVKAAALDEGVLGRLLRGPVPEQLAVVPPETPPDAPADPPPADVHDLPRADRTG